MLNDTHLNEWVISSGVSEEITRLNVVSMSDPQEIDKKLNRNNKRRWKHTEWGEGFWVSGVDPQTGEARGLGGQFKPDKSPDPDRKYFSISDSAATPLFLDTGDRDFWKNAIADSRIPIIITEGAKKAGAGLTIGIATISIPGVTTGQKLGRLKEDLTQFFQVGRRVYLAFDSDVMTKPQVQAALDRLGRLIAETGANVSVIQLLEITKGMDDYIVKYGAESFQRLLRTAPTFEEWRDRLKEHEPLERPETHRQHTLNEIRKRYAKKLRLNVMTKQVELDGKPLKPDHLYLELMQSGIDAGKEFVMDAFYFFASMNEYHPVQDYLQMCKLRYGSDTLNLLDKPSARYIGTEKPIHDVFLRKTLIAAVARAFSPGCKVDTALILQGKQGKRKSTFFKTLAGEWFDDSLSNNTSDKDEKLKLHSTWIMEWAELETIFSRKDVSAVKAFLSSSVDKFRIPFGKATESYPRHSLICGTTNSDDFLQDATGTRRFWVIPIPADKNIDTDKLKAERDQLWAAAVAAYERGDQWWLTSEEEQLSESDNVQYQRDDSWVEPISLYLEQHQEVSIKEVLEQAIGLALDRQDRPSQLRASDILRSLGYVKKHTKHGKVWVKKMGHEGHRVTIPAETAFEGDPLDNNKGQLLVKGHQIINGDPLIGDPSDKNQWVTTQTADTQELETLVTHVTHKSEQKKEINLPEIKIGDRVYQTNPNCPGTVLEIKRGKALVQTDKGREAIVKVDLLHLCDPTFTPMFEAASDAEAIAEAQLEAAREKYKRSQAIKLGDRVVIANLTALMAERPGFKPELQTAVYEVRKLNGEKAQCFYKGKTFSICTEWLAVI
jgi:predicted P-loop ATPase